MPPKVKTSKVDETFTEGVQEETLMEYVQSKLYASFVNNIPLEAIRELPGMYMIVFGVLAYLLSSFCFFYFIMTGFKRALRTEFITLDKGDGVCETIAKQNSGIYYGTSDGEWSGDENFWLSRSMYSFDLINYIQNYKNYKKTMGLIHDELQQLGVQAKFRDASENLLEWMSWETYSEAYVSQSILYRLCITLTSRLISFDQVFQMTGSPVDIFNQEYKIGRIAGINGTCPVSPETEMDVANAALSLTYSYSKYTANAVCAAAIDPILMGYTERYDLDSFHVEIDVNSLITAMAVS